MPASCPNCGGTVVAYRTDRQAIEGGEVILQWAICRSCRHVVLQHWHTDRPATSCSQGSSGKARGPGRGER